MTGKELIKSAMTAALLCLQITFPCSAADLPDMATLSENVEQPYSLEADYEGYSLKAEFELEKPLLPTPLAEEMPATTPRVREKRPAPRLKKHYRYYYEKEEIVEVEGERTIKGLLEKMHSWRYAPKQPKPEFTVQKGDRYLPNQYIPELSDLSAFGFPQHLREAESETAHLTAARKVTTRDACRYNLRLISDAVDRYFSDHPDEIIKSFNQDDVTSLNGRFVKGGYLKEPLKISEGCHYVNEHRLSELICGSQIYCTRHDNP